MQRGDESTRICFTSQQLPQRFWKIFNQAIPIIQCLHHYRTSLHNYRDGIPVPPTGCTTRYVLFSMLISRFPLIVAEQASKVKNLSTAAPAFRETSTSDQDSLPDQKDRALFHLRTFCAK